MLECGNQNYQIILHKRGLASKSVDLTCTGVGSLFVENRIPLSSASARPIPTRPSPDFEWNLRHTMEAADLLLKIRPQNRLSRVVLDLMLDERNCWQDSSGGWFHTSEAGSQKDLWSSAYALKLLTAFCDSTSGMSKTLSNNINSRLGKTIDFFTNEWDKNKWEIPGKVAKEENIMLLYIDLAQIFARYSKKLQTECLAMIESWLSPVEALSDSYLSTLMSQNVPVPPQQAYARAAYALYLSQTNSDRWILLFEKAIKYGLVGMFSCEWAFILDLSFSYKKIRNDSD